jgi:hypothetical protein
VDFFSPEKDEQVGTITHDGKDYRLTVLRQGINPNTDRFNLLHQHEGGETYIGCYWRMLMGVYQCYLIKLPEGETHSHFNEGTKEECVSWLFEEYDKWLEQQFELAYSQAD